MVSFLLFLFTVSMLAAVAVAIAAWVWRSLRRFDRGMGRAWVEGGWRRLFPARTATWEVLQRRIMNRIRRSVTISVAGVAVVPRALRVELASEDMAVLAPQKAFIENDLATALLSEAHRHGWRCESPPTVSLAAEATVPRGLPRVTASFGSAGPKGVPDGPRPNVVPARTDPIGPLARAATVTEGLAAARTAPWVTIDLESVDGRFADIDLSGVTGPVVVGRDDGADVTIDAPTASGRHAVLVRHGDDWQLDDLGSRNGTFVNGVRVAGPVRLNHGDEVAFSNSGPRFRYNQMRTIVPLTGSGGIR